MTRKLVISRLSCRYTHLLPLVKEISTLVTDFMNGEAIRIKVKNYKQLNNYLLNEITKKINNVPTDEKQIFFLNYEAAKTDLNIFFEECEDYRPDKSSRTSHDSLVVFGLRAILSVINLDPCPDLIIVAHFVLDCASYFLRNYISNNTGFNDLSSAYQVLQSQVKQDQADIFTNAINIMKSVKKHAGENGEYANVTHTKILFELWGKTAPYAITCKHIFNEMNLPESMEDAQDTIVGFFANWVDTGRIIQSSAASIDACVISSMAKILISSIEITNSLKSKALSNLEGVTKTLREIYLKGMIKIGHSTNTLSLFYNEMTNPHEVCAMTAKAIEKAANSIDRRFSPALRSYASVMKQVGEFANIGTLYTKRLMDVKFCAKSNYLGKAMVDDSYSHINDCLSNLSKAVKKSRSEVITCAHELGVQSDRFVSLTASYILGSDEDRVGKAIESIDQAMLTAVRFMFGEEADGKKIRGALKPALTLLDELGQSMDACAGEPFKPKPLAAPSAKGKPLRFAFPPIVDVGRPSGRNALRPAGHDFEKIRSVELAAVERYLRREEECVEEDLPEGIEVVDSDSSEEIVEYVEEEEEEEEIYSESESESDSYPRDRKQPLQHTMPQIQQTMPQIQQTMPQMPSVPQIQQTMPQIQQTMPQMPSVQMPTLQPIQLPQPVQLQIPSLASAPAGIPTMPPIQPSKLAVPTEIKLALPAGLPPPMAGTTRRSSVLRSNNVASVDLNSIMSELSQSAVPLDPLAMEQMRK